MDARTGKLVQDGHHIISAYKYLISKNSDQSTIDEYCCSHFECKNEEEFKAYFVPCVSEGVIEQCRFANIFNDEKTIFQLRPMVYEFWS
jgi:hypothetical protein